jgi:hypothetical protein
LDYIQRGQNKMSFYLDTQRSRHDLTRGSFLW